MKVVIKRLRILVRRHGKFVLASLALLMTAVGLLWWQLDTLTRGASQGEVNILNALHQQTLSLQDIMRSPIYLPYKFGLYLLEKTHFISLLSLRSLSATFGLAAVGLFYFLLSQWNGRRLAVLGTSLFVSSSWFLHTARLGSPLILFVFSLLSVLVCAILIQKNSQKNWPYMIAILVGAIAIYTPGLIWMILIALVWQYRLFWTAIRRGHPALIICIALSLIILTPLVIGISNHASMLLIILGSSTQPAQTVEWVKVLREMANVPIRLLIRNKFDPTITLGNVALLDGLTSVMAGLGIYALIKQGRFVRTQVIGSLLILGALLAGLSQGALIVLILPLIYILATAGISWFIAQWLTVFPRNRLAQTVGIGLLAISLFFVGVYHLRAYFVAWPRSPSAQASFRETNH